MQDLENECFLFGVSLDSSALDVLLMEDAAVAKHRTELRDREIRMVKAIRALQTLQSLRQSSSSASASAYSSSAASTTATSFLKEDVDRDMGVRMDANSRNVPVLEKQIGNRNLFQNL